MIPYRMNPMGAPEWGYLLDDHTKFLIYGSLQDRTGLTSVTNYGLVSDGYWISSPDQTSYAVIPANSLSSDVLNNSYNWSMDISFFIPENWRDGLSRRCGLFGCFDNGSRDRFDLLFIPNSSYFFSLGGIGIMLGNPIQGRNNVITINYTVSDGISFKLNGTPVGSNMQTTDITLPSNPRAKKLGIMANMNGSSVDSYAYMMKIKYIRISNMTR